MYSIADVKWWLAQPVSGQISPRLYGQTMQDISRLAQHARPAVYNACNLGDHVWYEEVETSFLGGRASALFD